MSCKPLSNCPQTCQIQQHSGNDLSIRDKSTSRIWNICHIETGRKSSTKIVLKINHHAVERKAPLKGFCYSARSKTDATTSLCLILYLLGSGSGELIIFLIYELDLTLKCLFRPIFIFYLRLQNHLAQGWFFWGGGSQKSVNNNIWPLICLMFFTSYQENPLKVKNKYKHHTTTHSNLSHEKLSHITAINCARYFQLAYAFVIRDNSIESKW